MISEELRIAYTQTHYRAITPMGDIVLRIGKANPQMTQLFLQQGLHKAAFITACNPHSQLQEDRLNKLRNAQLKTEISALGLPCYEAYAEAPAGLWAAEPSFMILGMSPGKALELAQLFDQNAFVFVHADAIPLLVDATLAENNANTGSAQPLKPDNILLKPAAQNS